MDVCEQGEGERPYVQYYLTEHRQTNQGHINVAAAVAAAMSLQSCPTLCDPIDSSQSGSPVPGILQARVLEWGDINVRTH